MVSTMPHILMKGNIRAPARVRRALPIALVLVALAGLAADAAFFVGRPVEIVDRISETFDGGAVAQPDAFEIVGLSPRDDGWALGPGGRGRIAYRIPFRADWRVLLRVWLYRAHPDVTNTVTVALEPSGPSRVIGRDVHWQGRWIDLARYAGQPAARFEVTVTNQGDVETLVLDRIDTHWYRDPPLPRLIAHPRSPGHDRIPAGAVPAPPAIRVAGWAAGLALGLSLLTSLDRPTLPSRRIAAAVVAASLGMLALRAFLTRL